MKLQDLRRFWRVMSSISLQEIQRQSSRSVTLAVVGTDEARREVLRKLYPDRDPDSAFPLVRSFRSMAAEDGFPQEPGMFDIVIDAGEGWAPTEAHISAFSIHQLGGWDATVDRLLTEKTELSLSLARRFPGLRDAVARHIIRETAIVNAEFAMLNALPGVVPVLSLLLPTAMVGDLIMLAKNQAMMLYRLAACYGLSLDPRARARDVLPLVGNAFGWRALARELVGIVPGGVGLVAKGAVAYAGTVALGEAMRRLYGLGEQPTRQLVMRLYRESLDEARAAAEEVRHRMKTLERPRLALPRWRGGRS